MGEQCSRHFQGVWLHTVAAGQAVKQDVNIGPPWRDLRTAIMMNKASLWQRELCQYNFLTNILVIYKTCRTFQEVSKTFKGGRKCNVRWTCGPSSHRFRQGGLDLITFNFPPAITFPVDHFPSQAHVCMQMCSQANARRERKEK